MCVVPLPQNFDPDVTETEGLMSYKKMAYKSGTSRLAFFVKGLKKFFKWEKKANLEKETSYGTEEDESYDWWSKYYASIQVRL